MKYCLKIIKKRRAMVLVYLALGVFSSFLHTWQAKYYQNVLDGFQSGSLTWQMIALFAFLTIGSFLINYLDEWPDKKLMHGIYLDFKLMAMEKLSRMDFVAWQSLGSGDLIQKIENGAQAGRYVLFNFFFVVIRSTVPAIAFSLFYIASIDKTVVLYIAFGYVLVAAVSYVLLKFLYRIKERILSGEEKLNRLLVRSFMELSVFRINRRFGREIAQAERAADDIVDSKAKMNMIHEAFFTIFAVFVGVIRILMIIYAWRTGNISVGAIVALVLLIDRAYQPIAVFNVIFVSFRLEKVALKRLTDILDEKDDERLLGGKSFVKGEGSVVFDSASYAYGEKIALENVSIGIKPHMRCAFVGESGSGKSTAAKLIAGLLVPNKGEVFIDGQDMSEVFLSTYFENVAYLSQETPVFDGTVLENIAFDRDVPKEAVLDAAEKAGLLGLIQSLPEGLNTRIGEKGSLLSGGERQRLAIARLLLSDFSIAVLDESLSALDRLTQEKVIQSLYEQIGERTLIVVSHLISSVKNCDRIFVFKEGGVIDSGTYDELYSRNDYFRALADKDEV
ncbi:MAG: ABC transporter ATP-binding protein [Clostridia bacterium]|nr:ABC transporter ATP-binding protein [Clostridia bacterium]